MQTYEQIKAREAAIKNAIKNAFGDWFLQQYTPVKGAFIGFIADWASCLLQVDEPSEPQTKQHFIDNGCDVCEVYDEYAPAVTFNILTKVTECAVNCADEYDLRNNINFAAYLTRDFIPAAVKTAFGECSPFVNAVPIDGITRRACFNCSEPFAFDWCSGETGEGFTIEQWRSEANEFLSEGVPIGDGDLLPFCDWVHIFVSVCNLYDYDEVVRFAKLRQAFGDKTTLPFLINNETVGEVTITPTDDNDYSFVVKYNDNLREWLPDDMARAIVDNDSEPYYISDFC